MASLACGHEAAAGSGNPRLCRPSIYLAPSSPTPFPPQQQGHSSGLGILGSHHTPGRDSPASDPTEARAAGTFVPAAHKAAPRRSAATAPAQNRPALWQGSDSPGD